VHQRSDPAEQQVTQHAVSISWCCGSAAPLQVCCSTTACTPRDDADRYEHILWNLNSSTLCAWG
jgi:hypothetical protein